MDVIKLLLEEEQKNLNTATSQIKELTFEQACVNLKFYCGWNPKTEEGIKKQIESGLPQLNHVKVKVRGLYVKITFFIGDSGIPRKYEYR